MFCRSCGSELPEGTKFCTSCGVGPSEGNKFCSVCGAEVQPGAEVCVKCGVRLAEPEILIEKEGGGAMFCWNCGKELPEGAEFCSSCGASLLKGEVRLARSEAAEVSGVSEKSRLAVTLLAWFLGEFGVHRFYLGKIGTGIAMLFTLGGLGIWALIDFIFAVSGKMKDKEGMIIEKW